MEAGHYWDGDGRELVYFVRTDDLIKIGCSAYVRKRFNAIRQANPRLVLVGVVAGGLDREAELHAQFAHLRWNGEWFHARAELLEFIASDVERYGMPRCRSRCPENKTVQCALDQGHPPQHEAVVADRRVEWAALPGRPQRKIESRRVPKTFTVSPETASRLVPLMQAHRRQSIGDLLDMLVAREWLRVTKAKK